MRMSGTSSTFVDNLRKYLRTMKPEERYDLIIRIQSILEREIVDTSETISDFVCPKCGGKEFIHYGKTAKGTERFQCTVCGNVRCHCKEGNIMTYTKLDADVWMHYAECFVDHISCRKVADRLGVTKKTAWFMRIRTLEALYKYMPSFQTKSNQTVELDEMYFRESFKGTRFDKMATMPREPRHEIREFKSGISDDQICVMTGLNDMGDFFFDVVCRGALTCNIAYDALKNRICSGTIVNTDAHKAYPRVLRDLSVSIHIAIPAKKHENLTNLDHIHNGIRTFMAPFHGVSTKWLHLYLCWFKWLRCFRDNCASAANQIVHGDYEHTWKAIVGMGSPFRDGSMNPVKLQV